MANEVGSAIDTAAAAGAVATDTISNRVGSALNGDWTDADIIAYLVAADSGEIAAGKLASTKATNPSVKAFAKKMASDHSTMLDETTKFASKASIAYASARAAPPKRVCVQENVFMVITVLRSLLKSPRARGPRGGWRQWGQEPYIAG
jgi:hypothetical protein